jgi:hypothetical protein
MLRWIALALILGAFGGLLRPVAAQQPGPRAAPGPTIPLSQLLASEFEVKGAVLAGVLVQNGRFTYICTTPQRERQTDRNCLPLHR